jgi:hypothetical protein
MVKTRRIGQSAAKPLNSIDENHDNLWLKRFRRNDYEPTIGGSYVIMIEHGEGSTTKRLWVSNEGLIHLMRHKI